MPAWTGTWKAMGSMRVKRINLVLLVLLLLALMPLLWPGLKPGQAQAPNQVGLVVQLGDGTLITRCIGFDEAEINSYDLLLRSGLNVVVSGDSTVGLTVCSIEDEGCPASDCFCQCKGSTCTYWSYWHLIDGAWQYSALGASGHVAAPGSVEGWSWGEAEPPPAVPFAELCVPPPTDTPVPTPTWTPSPTPAPTDTPTPTLEPTVTWTPSPTPVPPTDTPPPTETPLPTETPAPTATDVPTEMPAAGVPNTLQSTPEAEAPSAGEPQPTPTQAPAVTPAPSATLPPPTLPPTPRLTQTVQSPVAATQVPSATVLPTAEPRPTNTPLPTLVVLVSEPDPGASSAAMVGHRAEGPGGNSNLLTVISVGVGAAYLFFLLFVVALAGLFVIVRLRQR